MYRYSNQKKYAARFSPPAKPKAKKLLSGGAAQGSSSKKQFFASAARPSQLPSSTTGQKGGHEHQNTFGPLQEKDDDDHEDFEEESGDKNAGNGNSGNQMTPKLLQRSLMKLVPMRNPPTMRSRHEALMMLVRDLEERETGLERQEGRPGRHSATRKSPPHDPHGETTPVLRQEYTGYQHSPC